MLCWVDMGGIVGKPQLSREGYCSRDPPPKIASACSDSSVFSLEASKLQVI